jgi:cytochrome c553
MMKTLIALLGLTAMLSAADGAALYQKCAACHGLKGEKAALGKSEVISGWNSAKTLEALKGYKAGTRNTKGMGALMKGQTAALSDADMKVLADHIAGLK